MTPQPDFDRETCLSSLVPEYISSLHHTGDENDSLAAVDVSDQSESDSESQCRSGLILPSAKIQRAQEEQAIVMYTKRAGCVKRCEFRKFKEWARDFLGHHDKTQMDMLRKQLQKRRNDENHRPAPHKKLHNKYKPFVLDCQPKKEQSSKKEKVGRSASKPQK